MLWPQWQTPVSINDYNMASRLVVTNGTYYCRCPAKPQQQVLPTDSEKKRLFWAHLKVTHVLPAPSYSQCGWTVVDQAVQQPQQIILPVQVTKPLLHHLGKYVVLEILQRKDVFPFGKKEEISHDFVLVFNNDKVLWEKEYNFCVSGIQRAQIREPYRCLLEKHRPRTTKTSFN